MPAPSTPLAGQETLDAWRPHERPRRDHEKQTHNQEHHTISVADAHSKQGVHHEGTGARKKHNAQPSNELETAVQKVGQCRSGEPTTHLRRPVAEAPQERNKRRRYVKPQRTDRNGLGRASDLPSDWLPWTHHAPNARLGDTELLSTSSHELTVRCPVPAGAQGDLLGIVQG